MTSASPPKRGSKEVWNDIEDFLATTDGIATRDAVRLGALVREYGTASSGEAIGPIMNAMITGLMKPPKPSTPEAWREPL